MTAALTCGGSFHLRYQRGVWRWRPLPYIQPRSGGPSDRAELILAVAHRDGLAEFPQWLNADAPLDLSFTKLSTIGSALQMPFGALVRSVVPEAREDELIRYRTINNQGVEASRNLRDTIVTSRVSWLRTQGIAISVSSGCRPVSFKYRSAATGDRSPMSFVANGLRWMRSIAGPKQHAQTFGNV